MGQPGTSQFKSTEPGKQGGKGQKIIKCGIGFATVTHDALPVPCRKQLKETRASDPGVRRRGIGDALFILVKIE
ncbi:hypothetical protein OS42_21550 [Dickeya oryzae]